MKVKKIKVPEMYFGYLTSDEVNVLDAIFVSDEMIEIRNENDETPMWSSPLSPLRKQVLNLTMCWICCRKECCTTMRIR